MSWLPPIITVEPASEPVTLGDAKGQAEVQGTDHDTMLTSFIGAARVFVEEYTGTRLVAQTVELRCSSWRDLADLPVAPISGVSAVSYLDADGASQTLSTSVYETVLVGLKPSLRLKANQSWPTARCVSDAIKVTATAGYATVPEPIKLAILMLVASWFDNRSVGDAPGIVTGLLSNYRRF